jgi:hypothetical protein
MLKFSRFVPALVLTIAVATIGSSRESPIGVVSELRHRPAVPLSSKLTPPIASIPGQRRSIRFPDPRKVGLSEGTQVNAAIFDGLKLSGPQADSIAGLARGFALERRAQLAQLAPQLAPTARWDSATKQRMMPFIERERQSYRAVLTPEQRMRPVFPCFRTGVS